MKTTQVMTSLVLLTLTTACGSWNKNPVPDLDQLRANGQAQEQNLPQLQPQINYVPGQTQIQIEKVPYAVPSGNTDTVTAGSVLPPNAIVVSPDQDMNFTEGKTSTFKIDTMVLVTGVTIQLKPISLPAGATFQAVPQPSGSYALTWTPPVGSAGQIQATFEVDVTSAPDDVTRAKVQAFAAAMNPSVTLRILKDVTPPYGLSVSGLGTDVKEGAITPFTVTVTVPGADSATGPKPTLQVTYDGINVGTNANGQKNNFMELDGTRYVSAQTAPAGATNPTYLGNSKWQFNMNFDAKNVPVQPQLTATGKPMPNADGTRVRFSLKVVSPNTSSTPVQLVQLKIDHSPQALAAPTLDVPTALEISPGQAVSIDIAATSANASGVVRVDAGDLSKIPGTPKLTCHNSNMGAYRQVCTFTWKVPCDITPAQMTQSFQITAVTSVANSKSQTAQKTLDTKASATPNADAQKACAPTPNPAPAAKNPAPAQGAAANTPAK